MQRWESVNIFNYHKHVYGSYIVLKQNYTFIPLLLGYESSPTVAGIFRGKPVWSWTRHLPDK